MYNMYVCIYTQNTFEKNMSFVILTFYFFIIFIIYSQIKYEETRYE